jgi:16S rRNA C967 or C1407 C5-methylase (RsmB/RsmF family)
MVVARLSLEAAAGELRYRKDLLEMMVGIYGDRTTKVLECLRLAPREYAIRVNTLKTEAKEIVEALTAEAVRCRRSELVPEAVLIEVEGPFDVIRQGKQVVARKNAAESVMMGSKLYGPGVLRTDSYRIGGRVYITDVYDHVVGGGLAVMPPKKTNDIAKGMAVDTTESVYKLPPLRESNLYASGMIREQSLPAMITARELDPKPGETIVDMCAAPGGKTMHMAQLMEGEGRIYAYDHSEKRLDALRRDAIALGIKNIIAERRDSRFLKEDGLEIVANRVLVDPPCSALGVRPKLYEDCTLQEVMAAAKYQIQFLATAKSLTEVGGIIVYSTCTLSIAENEGVVKQAIDNLGLELVSQAIIIGEPGLLKGTEAAQRFSPDRVETPGYFIAKFRV